MKLIKIFCILFLFFVCEFLYSQVPEGFNYQAVARNNDGTPIANKEIVVEISILKDGETGLVAWQETHKVFTNSYGLFYAVIGKGTSTELGVYPSFSEINWVNGTYFLKIRVDFGAEKFGNGLLDMGTSPLLSVPYAFLSNNAYKAEDLVRDSNQKTKVKLVDLLDVDVTDLTENKTLLWNGTKWVVAYAISDQYLKSDGSIDLTADWNISQNNIILTNGKIFAAGLSLNNQLVETISVDTLLRNNSNSALITEKAVKSYVDNKFKMGYWTQTTQDLYTTNTNVNVGVGTRAESGYKFHAQVGTSGFLVKGDFNNAAAIPVIADAKPRMIFYPSKAAFRVGGLKDFFTYWSKDFIGDYSFAAGLDVQARGKYSVSLGYKNVVGTNGECGFAVGEENSVEGRNSFAAGSSNVIPTGVSEAFALGKRNNVKGMNSFALGFKNNTYELYSLAVGEGNNAGLLNGNTEGSQIVLGRFNTAVASASIAAGKGCQTEGPYSFAVGDTCRTGQNAEASFATGGATRTTGKYSFASGFFTKAISRNEFVIGQYNTEYANANTNNWVATDRLFVIGGGTSESNRADLLVVWKNGQTAIGTSNPAQIGGHKLYVFGTIGTSAVAISVPLMKNISPLKNVLRDISQLQGMSYQENLESRLQFGINPEFLEKIYPNLVYTNGNGAKSINYIGLVPVLLQAIKEQQDKIQSLEERLKKIEEKLEKEKK